MDVLKDMDHANEEAKSNELPVFTNEKGERKRNGIYLFTCPRSASNMFQTMLAKQDKYRHSGYWYFGAAMTALGRLPEGKWANLPEEDKAKYLGIYQSGYNGLMEEMQRAKDEGKEVLVKEHAVLMHAPDDIWQVAHGKDGTALYVAHSKSDPSPKHTNPTSSPDDLLLSMQPIFQIRHPALMFSSMARAEMDVGKATGPSDIRVHVFTRLHYSRDLYDWYLNTPGAPTPKVISADDIMNRPEVVRQLCMEVGLEPEKMQYEWDTRPLPEDNIDVRRFASTIYQSKGILPGYSSEGLDIEEKTVGWKKEFGEKEGEFLAARVKEAMADYEYLMERRVKV